MFLCPCAAHEQCFCMIESRWAWHISIIYMMMTIITAPERRHRSVWWLGQNTKWDWGEKGSEKKNRRKKGLFTSTFVISRIHYCHTKAIKAVVPVHLPALSQENWGQLSDVDDNVLRNDIHSMSLPLRSIYTLKVSVNGHSQSILPVRSDLFLSNL